MKLLIILLSLIAFSLLSACSDDDNPAAPSRPQADKDLFLNQSEANLLTTNNWCESIEMKYKGEKCNPILISHSFTKFSDKEFFAEVTYPKEKRVYCDGWHMSAEQINDFLENASYRVSFTGKNLATMTQVAGDKKSEDVEFFVNSASVKFAPLDKTVTPGNLSACRLTNQ